MSVTTNTGGNAILTRLYNANSVDDCRALYDEWAETYDADLLSPALDYVAPTVVAQAVLSAHGSLAGKTVLDAGCGTGLSGIALREVAAADSIDGVDLSPGMLKVAERSGVYKSLATADLSKPIEKGDGVYDVVACVGTLTHGHVGPVPALREFLRVAKKGGLVVATVLDDIWASGGYEAEVERLKGEGLAHVLGAENMDYRKGSDVKARVLVMKKT